MDKISTIYLKELSNIEEIFKDNSRLPNFFKKTILFLKKIFCVVTVNKNGFYVLPYKDFKNFTKAKLFFIKKILVKLDSQVVLSRNLNCIDELKNIIKESNIQFIEGKTIANYLIPEIVEYICKITGEKIEKQDVSLLIENKSSDIERIIIELAKKVKRIQIVTNKILQFKRLENELETEYGLACQISNNKRKSILKSKIIINFDMFEQNLNQYLINPNAIVIDINKNTRIITKTFSGIHIYDYEISSKNKDLPLNIFDIKKIYEERMLSKNYAQIRNIIKDEDIRITNLIGKKGIIDRTEYVRAFKKLD